MTNDPKGLVLHISDGTLDKGIQYIPNLNGLAATFNASDFPAHFGISAEGSIAQYIDTSKQDRATERGVEWFSVECCAFRGNALTPAQVASAGLLFAILHKEFPTFPLEEANSPNDRGLAYHSLFLTAAEKSNPKKHGNCPGPLVIAQRAEIIRIAGDIF